MRYIYKWRGGDLGEMKKIRDTSGKVVKMEEIRKRAMKLESSREAEDDEVLLFVWLASCSFLQLIACLLTCSNF